MLHKNSGLNESIQYLLTYLLTYVQYVHVRKDRPFSGIRLVGSKKKKKDFGRQVTTVVSK